MRGTFAHFLTFEEIPYRVGGVPVGILATRAGYKELEAIPQYPVDVLLDAVDVDAVDVDEFEPIFPDFDTSYME